MSDSNKTIIWLLIAVAWVVAWSEDVLETGVITADYLIVAFGPLVLGLSIWLITRLIRS